MPGDDPVGLDLHDGDHACILFASDEDHRVVVGQFLAQGLATGQRVLNIACAHSPATMREYFRDAGADPTACEASGQLTILNARETYAPEGIFDPDEMIAMLGAEVERAVAQGWDGMRGSGDMSWALQDIRGNDRIMDYEAKLNYVIPGSRFRALCQYDMRRFPADVILQVLAVHPVAFVGTQQLENFYFTPPDEFLSGPQPEAQLARWITNLRERQTSEALRRAEIRQEERMRSMQEELAAKTEFMNSAAHALATPLTPLSLQVQHLKTRDPESPLGDHTRSIAIIARGLDRLKVVAGQLVEAVKAGGGAMYLRPEHVDLCRLVRESAEAFAAAAEAQGAALRVECPGRARTLADPVRIGQVLDHLLANAIKTDATSIVVSVRPQSGGWSVAVEDSGIGLTQEQAQRLFQPFSQVHASMTEEGMGLGLFISRNIVELHRGRMWAQGTGAGAQVGFWLPADAQAAPAGVASPRPLWQQDGAMKR